MPGLEVTFQPTARFLASRTSWKLPIALLYVSNGHGCQQTTSIIHESRGNGRGREILKETYATLTIFLILIG